MITPGLYRCETTRPLQKIEPGEFVSLFVLPYGLGLVYLLIGIWVFRQRGNQRTSQVLALFAGTSSIIFATYFDGLTTNRLQWVAFLAMGASSGALLSLSLLFPETARVIERRPLIRFLVYVPGLAFAALASSALLTANDPWAYVAWQRWVLVALAAAIPVFIGLQIYRRWRSDSPIVLQQSRIILWGSTFALLPFVIWVGLSIFRPTPFNPWLYMFSTILFPLSIAYAMLRYHQLNFDQLLTAAASYVLAGMLVVVIYFGMAYLVSLVAGSSQTLFANPGLAVALCAAGCGAARCAPATPGTHDRADLLQEPLRHAGPAAELQPPPDRSVGTLVGGAGCCASKCSTISGPRCCMCICWTCA